MHENSLGEWRFSRAEHFSGFQFVNFNMEDDNKSTASSYGNLRPKKPQRSLEENDGTSWDCSVCTFKNNAEAFKCSMCDTRKGTSTRKPKVNSQLVAQQTAQQLMPTPPKVQKTMNIKKNNSCSKRSGFSRPRLKIFDQNSEQQMEVTVGNVTVVITDYKLLPVKEEKSPPASPKEAKDESLEVENECLNNKAADIETSEEKVTPQPEIAVSS